MSYCVRIANAGDRWLVVTPQDKGEELDAVKLVTEAPEFLGLLDPAGLMPRAAVVAPGSASGRVLLAINEYGRIRLVACPEKGDEAELGGLMADLLSISGRLWRQPYDVVAGPFEQSLGVPLDSRVGERAGKSWTSEAFRAGVEKSLQDGRFPVTVIANDLGKPLQDMLGYLKNMNLEVNVLGYSYVRGGGIETVMPVSVSQPGRAGTLPPRSQPTPGSERRPAEPLRRSIPGQMAHGEQHTQTVTFSTKRPARAAGPREPFPADGASPDQQRVLEKLVELDDLGLVRRGLEYFVRGYEQRDSAEGTVVISVDGNRWPFPKPEEVIVVVNTGPDHLAGHFKLSPAEIEEFLGSLPRVQRKEHRGAVLLRASTIQEADQLVNELRALKEVSETGV
jgi:hypothetical protein